MEWSSVQLPLAAGLEYKQYNVKNTRLIILNDGDIDTAFDCAKSG